MALSIQHVHYGFVQVWECPELSDSGAAEAAMGFIQRARLIEMQRNAARASAAWGSNGPRAQRPLAQGQEVEAPVYARDSAVLDYLDDATSFEEELRVQGDSKLGDEVEGVLHHRDGCLTIGAEAIVEADLVVRDVVIAGLVKGNVDASGVAEIHASGVLHGDLRTRRIHIHEGGVVVGVVHVGEDRIAGESDPLPKRAPARVAPEKPEAAA
jgi:cytoskeletal protein CcmA (bactofilin family)